MTRALMLAALLASATTACGGDDDGTATTDGGPACGALTECGGSCVDTDVDPTHCGGCDVACADGEVCGDGACGVYCAATLIACGGSCRDTQTDPSHCGGCDTACSGGQACEAGTCVTSCSDTLTDCGGSCRDAMTDRAHCGGCDMACSDGEVCNDGACSLSCGGGLLNCSEVCRDPMSDEAHCGACDAACAAGEVCNAGVCEISCTGDFMDCAGTCRDTMSDRSHCGGCDMPCGASQFCMFGTCLLSCPPGQSSCGGACRDTMVDPSNCGMCGSACMPGEVCSMGSCTFSCGAGTTDCSGTCRDLMTDEDNCGGCGTVCRATERFCIMGTCMMPPSTVPPQTISAMMSCTTAESTTGRKVAVDAGGNFYAVMLCGTTVYASRSTDGGISWSAPATVGLTSAAEVTVAGGPAGVAYVAMVDLMGAAVLVRTTDSGATWSPSTTLPGGTGMVMMSQGISIATRADALWVATSGTGPMPGLRVWRNITRGTGPFPFVDVMMSAVFFDVLVEQSSGTVWVTADDPMLHLRRSTDGGATFLPEGTPPMGDVFFSDWTMADGAIFTAGAMGMGAEAYRINPATLTSTPLTAVVSVPVSMSRSISADATGRVYTTGVTTGGMAGVITLQRLLPMTTAFRDTRTITMLGSAPSVAAVPGSNAAVVVYTEGSTVRVTTQGF